jgi:hypothetical protein
MRVREVRRLAKKYAAELLRGQDLPDWAIDYNVPDKMYREFLLELERIAERIYPVSAPGGLKIGPQVK